MTAAYVPNSVVTVDITYFTGKTAYSFSSYSRVHATVVGLGDCGRPARRTDVI